jgi:D-serine deaminase-like pyridoxal phosphate-dependent protein
MFNEPTLILDETKCKANIKYMVAKANKLNLTFRPHFKTHQSLYVGSWFKELGVSKITVSSVPMAKYFASGGWDDITIAFPFVPHQANEINNIAKSISLNLVASSVNNANLLVSSINNEVGVFIEVDTGQARSGFQIDDYKSINETIQIISAKSNLKFKGFLNHAGQSYQKNSSEIENLNDTITLKLSQLKGKYINKFSNIIVSYGDTPTSWKCHKFIGVDELRPGNFTFFDMQQASQNICTPNNIAIALICPVAAVYPERNIATIWGGAVHLSKDFYIDINGNKSFGAICKLNSDNTWSEPICGLSLESVSQEHGMIRATSSNLIETIKEGDSIAILPAHSCLTVDKMRKFWVKGKGYIEIMK